MLLNQVKYVLAACLLSVAFVANGASSEKPNYVVKPTTFFVGPKGQSSVSGSFSSKVNDGPYQLIIKNGSGDALEKQICSGNLLKQLLCAASNLVIDLRISVERVSSAEIILNGNKVVTSKEVNSKVANYQATVQLKANNSYQVNLKGLLSSSITVEIRGKSGAALSGTLAIAGPLDQSTVAGYSTLIEGQISSSAPDLKVMLNNVVDIPLSGSNFSYQFDYLAAGQNALTLSLYSGATLLDTKAVNVVALLPGESGGLISANGGSVSIADTASELYGSAVMVPSDSLASSRYLVIQHGDEWGPTVPYDQTSVGPVVSFNPFLLKFSKSVTLMLPYVSSKMPAGALQENIKVVGFDGEKWVLIEPSGITSNSVSIETAQFNYYAYQAVVETPILDSQLQVLANITGATIYVDGLFKGDLTPGTLESISNGSHVIKIYREGYNEFQQTISYPSQKRLNVSLTPVDAQAPSVQFAAGLSDGMNVSDNLIVINGQIGLDSSVANTGFVVLSQNSRDISQALSADGKFSFVIPLFKGINKIQVRATVNGKTGVSQKINIIQGQTASLLRSLVLSDSQVGDLAGSLEQDPYSVSVRNEKLAAVPQEKNSSRAGIMALAAEDDRLDQQIKIVLTWGKNDTDVDMHVTDEYGGHAWYGSLGGIEQGTLDRDDVDGFGPEIFTLDRPRPGKYPIRIHYFSDHGNGATTATLQVFLAGQVVFQGSQSLSTGQSWNAYTIDVQGITISNAYALGGLSDEPMPKECASYSNYTCVNNIFTTSPAESSMVVEVSAPESLLDSQIRYRVTEKSQGFSVPVTSVGRSISFSASNKPLVGLASPRFSKRLVYEIVAYTDTGIESDPYYIVQDTRSQIRQEYVDKKKFTATFTREIPSYLDISNGSAFPGPNFYTYSEFVQFSDFKNFGLGILGPAIQYANSINSAYKARYPEVSRLQLNSGWRNPRRNDSLPGSDVNSFHPYGGSLDFVPARGALTESEYQDKLTELCEIAYSAVAGIDVINHLNHVHIEPSNGSRVKRCR